MTFKRTISLLMVLVLILGLAVPGLTAIETEGDSHTHTYGEWVFDTENGTQSHTCEECNHTEILYGTDTKVSRAEAPAVGESYYLAANVDGTVHFFRHGTVSDTKPYSLVTTDNVNHNWAFPLTLEAPDTTSDAVKNNIGFQLTYKNPTSGATTRIYCYDVLTTTGNSGIMDTGANTANYTNRHTFKLDEVNGVPVLRKLGNNNILVVKYDTAKSAYRMLGVPESELAKEGVYPAMLVNVHSHSYSEDYSHDADGHWKTCACGSLTEKENHDFQMDEALGYEVCICGADKKPHVCENTDGLWQYTESGHFQLCNECSAKLNEGEHTFDPWIMDEENGLQSRPCTACGYSDKLYGTEPKIFQVAEPVMGEGYYLAANAAGQLRFFILEGSVTDTKPYSLHTTGNAANAQLVLPEAAVSGDTGFQLSFIRQSDGKLLRIYCYDAGGSDGIMDTGTNAGNELEKHTFYASEFNGIKVLRKLGNDNILAVKYNEAKSEWRMLGVTEDELAEEGVYPVMLAQLHTHSFGTEYSYDRNGHWFTCDCGSASEPELHSFAMDEALGYEVCICGAELKPHDCESSDGVWYAAGEQHYQLCGICNKQINLQNHTYGEWDFDEEQKTQSKTCADCGHVQTLWGTGLYKVFPVEQPVVGESYYLSANVDGTIRFFRHGQVTDTTPCSLWVTDDVTHNWAFPVKLEAPLDGDNGFQMQYVNPSTSTDIRIYCYDSVGSDGIMDTGTNATAEYAKHTFFIDEVNGVKVLRKAGNNHILVVKYIEDNAQWRMLGVPESELANEGVYPAMLTTLHEHTYSDSTYNSDELGHWFTCQCGGKSNYADHLVDKWTYTTRPTQTTPGSKTGVCRVCGATALVEVPPVVAEGYYYLTGTLDGVKYYFRDKTGTESVEHTLPFSLLTTEQESKAMQVNILWDEKANSYTITYFTTRELRIYMADVNGNTVQKDGMVDLSSSATTVEDYITFYWDPATRMFYQLEGGVKYVIAFRKMTLTDGQTQAVRMLAVPETELDEDTAALQLQVIHEHAYAESWSYDAVDHWHACSCGTKKDAGAHTVEQWQINKEATAWSAGQKSGVCTGCGQTIVHAIPMRNDNVTAPANGSQYYLVGVLNGNRYYFRHAASGASVTDTIPYGLVTVTQGKANLLKIKVSDGNYNLIYGTGNYHIYMNGNGVGVTSNASKTELVNFQWDEENKLLYQVEDGVKCVLVFRVMRNNKTGSNEVRITSMPMDAALIDTTVAIARFSTVAPPEEPKEKKEPVTFTLPEDATPLKTAEPVAPPVEIQHQDDAISPHSLNKDTGAEGGSSFVMPALICVAVLALVAALLILLRNTKFGIIFLGKWNVWTAIAFVLAGVVLVAGMLLVTAPMDSISLSEFTIVANAGNLDTANDLAVTIYEKYGISIPVVQSKNYEGNKGIYLDTQGINSYGGYKYSVYSADDEYGAGIYINGSGASLDTAISKWLKSIKDTSRFPFGLKESISGYEWNTDDINMTGLGFTLKEQSERELYEGVQLRELKYESFGYGKVTGYAVIVEADAGVELKVAAGKWDENTTADNPGEKHTVAQYGKMLTDDGYEVLAITNAGFYDLNTTMTYIPWGMQIVDGYVHKKPNEDNPNNTDNWFGQTADGKYVISNTAGYYDTYETTIAQGVGGGRVLMADGKPCFSTTGADYRTVVGVTKAGDLIILTVPSANYAFVTQIFMDMDLDIDCVLNLDGGGSTTLHSLDENGSLKQFICETPIEREVADAIAIVKKN